MHVKSGCSATLFSMVASMPSCSATSWPSAHASSTHMSSIVAPSASNLLHAPFALSYDALYREHVAAPVGRYGVCSVLFTSHMPSNWPSVGIIVAGQTLFSMSVMSSPLCWGSMRQRPWPSLALHLSPPSMFHTVSSLQMPYAPREWSSDIRTRMLLTKPVGIRDLPLLKSKTHVDSVTLSPHVADPVPNSNLSDAPGAR